MIMRKLSVIILLALLSNVIVFADDNVEQMASTLGDGESATVGTNLLLNIKPRTAASSTDWQELTGSDSGTSMSIVGGQVRKGTGGSSAGSGVASGAGISRFNSGRRSSVTSTSATTSSVGGGPRKVGPGNIGDPGAAEDTPVGAAPFALILLLSIGYGLYKKLIFNDEKPSS